jgi:hypothetical protein
VKALRNDLAPLIAIPSPLGDFLYSSLYAPDFSSGVILEWATILAIAMAKSEAPTKMTMQITIARGKSLFFLLKKPSTFDAVEVLVLEAVLELLVEVLVELLVDEEVETGVTVANDVDVDEEEEEEEEDAEVDEEAAVEEAAVDEADEEVVDAADVVDVAELVTVTAAAVEVTVTTLLSIAPKSTSAAALPHPRRFKG